MFGFFSQVFGAGLLLEEFVGGVGEGEAVENFDEVGVVLNQVGRIMLQQTGDEVVRVDVTFEENLLLNHALVMEETRKTRTVLKGRNARSGRRRRRGRGG